MAGLTLNLSQFKADGVYTIEIDQSQNVIVTPQTIRLVVGFSKQGPFNAPVYCPDIKTAQTVFGNIDTSLERKGSFFHRELFTALQTGPCFALNLLIVNDDQTSPDMSDRIDYISMSVDTAEDNGVLTPRLYSSFFNKQKFWFNDPSYFLATVATIDKPKLLDITNVGQTPMSIIIKKSNVTGYDVTVSQWYQTIGQPQPAFLNGNDFISDYFIDVVAIAGNWTNYVALASDPVYSQFFNLNGFIYQAKTSNPSQDLLNQFISRPEIQLVASLTGCIIPDFTDQTGTNQYIQTIVNNTTGFTGLFCAVNEAAFDADFVGTSSVDLVGNHLIDALLNNQKTIDLISYSAPLVNDQLYPTVSPGFEMIIGSSPYDVLIANSGGQLYTDWVNGVITDGDYMQNSALVKQYLKFTPGTDIHGNQYVEVKAYTSTAYTAQESIYASGTTYNSSGTHVVSGWDIIALYGSYNEFFPLVTPDPTKTPLMNNQFIISGTNAQSVNISDLIVDNTAERLTRVLKKQLYDAFGNVLVTTQSPINIYPGNEVQKFQRLQDFVKTLNFFYLQGFTLQATAMPDGSTDRQDEILNVMFNTNIATTLANKNVITFRYIVDTFANGIEPECKYPLGQLAILRKKAIALLNAPSAANFINSTDPVFTDAPTAANPKPLLDTSFIASGGNQNLNPSFTFGLVSQTDGSQYVGYFFPFLVLLDNNKNVSIPPSAHVSNLFVQKFLNGTPYAIVAGPRRGLITDPNLVGVEYELTDDDRANLQPFGFNPIVRLKGTGVMIFGNETGYQTVNSALNNLHVRDLLVTVEDDLETILTNYLYEFNEASTRLEISSIVTSYLEGVLSAGGITDFQVIMDTSNNTPAIIGENFGIIDVIVEPAHGIQKFINRVTIAKTGAVASGGFSVGA